MGMCLFRGEGEKYLIGELVNGELLMGVGDNVR